MDFSTTQQNVAIKDLMSSENEEFAVDCEFTLPDYCPDIERILKCIVKPNIMSTAISGNMLAIEGMTNINVLYSDSENGQLRSHESQVSFSKNVDLKNNCENAVAVTNCKVDYMNCRAISERKLDVHGAFTVNIKMYTKKGMEVLSDAQGAGIQLQKCLMDVSEMAGFEQKQIILNDDLELSQSNGSINNILRSNASAMFSDCKIISNKIIVKGELMINMLYCNNDGMYEKFDYSMPVSQIVDVDGIDDSCTCNVKMDVISCELKPRTNISGESRTVSAVVKIELTAIGSKKQDISVITDAYSTKYDMSHKKEDIAFERKVATINEQHLAKNTAVMDDTSIMNVVDLWCNVISKEANMTENGLVVMGDILVTFLMKDNDNKIICNDRTMGYEFHAKVMAESKVLETDIDVILTGCSYTLSGDNAIEVRCELQVTGDITEKFKLPVMTEIVMDETKMKSLDAMAALVIYYAEPGESIWDIARRYNTSVDEMIELNDLAGDKLQVKTMLLIPSI